MRPADRRSISPFAGNDGAIVRELASPRNASLTRRSLAEIWHPLGTASREDHHTEAEEVYHLMTRQGGIPVDGETRTIMRGDAVIIAPGVRQKVATTDVDLVLLIPCAPAHGLEVVVFTDHQKRRAVCADGVPQLARTDSGPALNRLICQFSPPESLHLHDLVAQKSQGRLDSVPFLRRFIR